MSPNPLDTPITLNTLYRLARSNHLTVPALDYALHKSGLLPDRQAWRRFLDHKLLFFGAALVIVGIIFFFAYNWAEMDRFAKFALIQAGLLMTALFALWRFEHLSGQVALLATAVLLGVLLAVYGQIYQTGADAFSLFLAWAILIIPWVFVSAFAPLWFLLVVLLNLSLILYWAQVINLPGFYQNIDLFLLLFVLNGLALALWEEFHRRQVAWLQGNWLGRILFVTALILVIIPTLYAITEGNFRWQTYPLLVLMVVLYLITTGLALWYYQAIRQDLLLLAVDLLGIIIVLTTFVGKILPLDETISWLIVALIVIGQATLASKWLLQRQEESS
jgi:uncharacterized membrane protein